MILFILFNLNIYDDIYNKIPPFRLAHDLFNLQLTLAYDNSNMYGHKTVPTFFFLFFFLIKYNI